MSFQVGSVVVLKGGIGPRLTVAAIDGSDVTCLWFNLIGTSNWEAKFYTFPSATLEAVKSP